MRAMSTGVRVTAAIASLGLLNGCGASRQERVASLADTAAMYSQLAAAEEAVASLHAVFGEEEEAAAVVAQAAEYAQQAAAAAEEAEQMAQQDTGGGFWGGMLGVAGMAGGGAIAGAVGGAAAELAEMVLLTAGEIMASRATVENLERESAERRRESAAADLQAEVARGQANEAELARLRAADIVAAAGDEQARAAAEAELERRADAAAEAQRKAADADEVASRRRAAAAEAARLRRQGLLETAEVIGFDLSNVPEEQWHEVLMNRLNELQELENER